MGNDSKALEQVLKFDKIQPFQQMNFLALPPQERLRELFDYCPQTGILTHKRLHKRMHGKPAGCYRTRRGGRKWLVLVSIDHVQYPAHRLIWRYVTGEDPAVSIDHIDRNPFNNCWSNLRLADNWLQSQNREWIATEGHKGISYKKEISKWTARKVVNGERIHLGTFLTKEEAIKAMDNFVEQLCQQDSKWKFI